MLNVIKCLSCKKSFVVGIDGRACVSRASFGGSVKFPYMAVGNDDIAASPKLGSSAACPSCHATCRVISVGSSKAAAVVHGKSNKTAKFKNKNN